jgi:deoxycytidine triphosphate deaminase
MKQKKIKLKIQEYSINKIVGNELELFLHERANVIDAINEVDKIIRSKGKFPSEHYGSLLHWVYNPVEERFYEQTAISAYTASGKFLNIRNNPKIELPDDTTVILIPEGGCVTAREEVLDYETFCKAISKCMNY